MLPHTWHTRARKRDTSRFHFWCLFVCSVDGHPLPIDELRGTKPVEAIDLSEKGLGVASGMIIAACIAGNQVTTSLKCAAQPRKRDTRRYPVCAQFGYGCPLSGLVCAAGWAAIIWGQKEALQSQLSSQSASC